MVAVRFRFASRALAAAALASVLVAAVPIQAGTPSEHQVKAAFLYNFANFVEWPDGALGPAGAPI
jgi:hypothetical protein